MARLLGPLNHKLYSLVAASFVLALAVTDANIFIKASLNDGFVASCTGNLDGTGLCANTETQVKYSCLIIPGQVIDCKSRLGSSFQCVAISGIQSNQADFWCDPSVDQRLNEEISSESFRRGSGESAINQASVNADNLRDLLIDQIDSNSIQSDIPNQFGP